jgi:hypothetical protein
VTGEFSEGIGRIQSNVVVMAIQQRNESWNGRPNCLAKLDLIRH